MRHDMYTQSDGILKVLQLDRAIAARDSSALAAVTAMCNRMGTRLEADQDVHVMNYYRASLSNYIWGHDADSLAD